MKVTQYKTFSKSRAVRLKDFDYSLPYAYLITISCKDKIRFFENRVLAESMTKCLIGIKEKINVKIFAYCFMPDHLHLILSPQNGVEVSKIMKLFKGNATQIFWKLGFIGRLWQKSYHDHILRKNENLREAIRYVLNNPVRANLVSDYKNYKFCGVIDEVGM